ncbi:MAG: glycoside hydrolase family 3 protein [Elusimicrobia bacterium]|nr:glycoside hydrolase family 3 protein [Elusimicrobiota bacterium]
MKKLHLILPFVFALFAQAQEISLKDKISQCIIVSADTDDIEKIKKLLSENIGGIQLQWGDFSLQETQKFTSKIYESTFIFHPFIAIDYEGGTVFHSETLGLMDLPTNMMLGAANDNNDTASLFYLAGLELKKAGINMSFTPVLDVNSNPMNPIIGIRSFSSNPEKVYMLGNSVINGFKAANILSSVKHFPGHGDTYLDSHKTLPQVNLPEHELINRHIYPFKRIIDEKNADCLMTAHVLYPALDKDMPASLSAKIMKNILRENLKYDNLIITDSLDMKAITSKYDIPTAAFTALKNGADLLLIGRGDFYAVRDKIVSEVLKGNIDINRINESFERIQRIKKRYNLGNPRKGDEFNRAYDSITRSLSAKAVTLFKDSLNFLPLDSKSGEIAAIFFVPERFYPDTIVFYKKMLEYGYDIKQYNFSINPSAEDLAKVEDIAKRHKSVLIGSFQWSGVQNFNQKKAINKILSLSLKPVLISLMSPYDISNYPKAPSIMLTYGITPFTMETLADILSGKSSPKGVLPVQINFD